MKQYRQLLLSALLSMCVGFAALASAPIGYYRTLNGLKGQALKNAVHNLIKQHTVVTYSSLWRYFPSTDCMPSDKSRVWDMYSNRTYYFNGFSGVSGMHKEHSFPKSWWGGTEVDAYTDLHHLYPSDGDANMAKSNHPLGEVDNANFDNGVTKVGLPVKGQGGGDGTVFEPDDAYKGDFARTYFYMATCYQDYKWKYTYMVNNSSWKTLNTWAIDLLLKWSRNDPVSDKETDRNDAVYRVQNNRNPFIDHPELIEYIWGDKQDQVFNIGGGDDPQGEPTLITPTQGTELYFGEIGLGKSIDYVVWVKGEGLTNALSTRVYKNDYAMFTTSVKSIDRTVANSEQGYPLVITYTPTAVGNHKAKLLLSDGGLVGSIGVELSADCLPVPTLSALTATAATNVTSAGFVANWIASTDAIDYYIVNHVVLDEDDDEMDREAIIVDASETSYEFSNVMSGYKHAYTVQSYRLGYTSPESNVITIEGMGITGDINGDGQVNVSDVTMLINIILGTEAPKPQADVNADGDINVSDVTSLINIILG
ncbi:MAG: endonuclease [Bacteroidales bacterium]|nr:endonuclease [Bacteroidales bacterium]